MARKIDQTLKVHKLEENAFKMVILKSIFSKMPITKFLFTCSAMGARMKSSVETSESDDECAKCQGSYNEGEEWLYCPVCRQCYHEDCFLCNSSNPVLLLDFIYGLY